MIEVHWDVGGERPLSDGQVSAAAEAALAHGGRGGLGLSVVLMGDAALAALHARYLGDPSETDVMSFDLGEDGHGPGGELYVSVERARARAVQRGVPVARELALYVVHGALHLCGYDDHEDGARAAMRVAEGAVMGALGYPPDDAPHELGA